MSLTSYRAAPPRGNGWRGNPAPRRLCSKRMGQLEGTVEGFASGRGTFISAILVPRGSHKPAEFTPRTDFPATPGLTYRALPGHFEANLAARHHVNKTSDFISHD